MANFATVRALCHVWRETCLIRSAPGKLSITWHHPAQHGSFPGKSHPHSSPSPLMVHCVYEQNKNPPLFTNSGNSVGRQRRVEESETAMKSSARRGHLALSPGKTATCFGRGTAGDPGLHCALRGTAKKSGPRQVRRLTYRQPHSETSELPSNSKRIRVHELNNRREGKEVPRVMESLVGVFLKLIFKSSFREKFKGCALVSYSGVWEVHSQLNPVPWSHGYVSVCCMLCHLLSPTPNRGDAV